MGRRHPDPRPTVELWGADATAADAPRTIQVGGRRSRRGPLLAGVAAIALLAGGLALGGDDDEGSSGLPREEHDNRMRDDLKPPIVSTATTIPRATSTSTTTTVVAGPVLPVQTGAALLLSATGSSWTWLDLDTGRRLEVDLGVAEPYNLTPVSGGVVSLAGGSMAEYHPLPAGIPRSLGPADQIFSSGSPDTVWLLRTMFDGPTLAGAEAVLVDLEGNERSDIISLPAAYPVGATEHGMVFSRGGRTYVAEAAGIRPLALGDALRSNRTSVVVLSCDDQAVCAPEVVDIATGSSRRLAPIPNPYEMGINVLLSDDGDIAIATYQENGQTLLFYDDAGHLGGSVDDLSSQSEPRWLPGGMGLVAPATERGGVVRIALINGGVLVEPINGFDGEFGDYLYVIPR